LGPERLDCLGPADPADGEQQVAQKVEHGGVVGAQMRRLRRFDNQP
jgi:hypothetical protein